MKDLPAILDGIESELDEKDEVRELALKSARTIARLSTSAIAGMHRGEDAGAILADAREEVLKLKGVLEDHPDLYHAGFVENAFQELCEAFLVHAILRGSRLPDPRNLGVTNEAYLLGLGDAVGELRRFALEHLRQGEVDVAGKYLGKMETIYDALMRFDYPSALVPIKRKQDIARSLIEKTRGEVAVATRGRALEEKIDRLQGGL